MFQSHKGCVIQTSDNINHATLKEAEPIKTFSTVASSEASFFWLPDAQRCCCCSTMGRLAVDQSECVLHLPLSVSQLLLLSFPVLSTLAQKPSFLGGRDESTENSPQIKAPLVFYE